jgi:hypothetical protein
VGDRDERRAGVVVRLPNSEVTVGPLFRTKDFRLVVRDTFTKYSSGESIAFLDGYPYRCGGTMLSSKMDRRQYGRSILHRQCAPCRGHGFCERTVDLHRSHNQAGRLNARDAGIAGRSPLEIDGLKVPLLADGSELK